MNLSLHSKLQTLKKRIPAYRLFLKIFLWFWATALGIFLLTGVSNMLTDSKDARAANVYANLAPALAAQAVNLYESGDRNAFGNFIQNNIYERYRKVYLLDGGYEDVLRREVEDDGLYAAKATLLGHLNISDGHIAYKVLSATGHTYTLLIYKRSDLGNLKELLFRRDFISTIAMYLLAGLFSLWLTYHIASPIHGIQSTARRVASGDLSARVPAGVSERHDELGALAIDFDSMVDRLESLIRAQKTLLGSASHEVRSPLARITLSLAILKREWAGRSDDVLFQLESDVQRIDALMGQLLTLSRLEAGISSAEREDVNISQVLVDVTADCDFEARSQNKSVSLNATDRIYLKNADSHALTSAFENIIRNAVRFTRPGTNVEVAVKEVQHTSQPSVVVVVRDRGPGIPEESLQAIFQPFVQVKNNQPSEEGHNGLGLAIASEAIRMHHGSITASNLPSGGLEVWVQLPVGAHATARATHLAV